MGQIDKLDTSEIRDNCCGSEVWTAARGGIQPGTYMIAALLSFALVYILLKAAEFAEQVETECQRCGRQLSPSGFCPKCDM